MSGENLPRYLPTHNGMRHLTISQVIEKRFIQYHWWCIHTARARIDAEAMGGHMQWYRWYQGQAVSCNISLFIYIYNNMIYNSRLCIYFCLTLFCCGYSISYKWIQVVCLPQSFRVASLALGQSYDCPSANEATLKDMGKIYKYQTTTKHTKAKALHIISSTQVSDSHLSSPAALQSRRASLQWT